METYTESFKDEKDEGGRRAVVRNGSHKPRELITGVGKIPIRQPRVLDRRLGQQFTSAILPKYMRRAPSIDALIPALYLKGVSTSSFPEALSAILGENAPGLSPGNIVRLNRSGMKSIRGGNIGIFQTNTMCISGQMGSISTSAWSRIGPVFWSSSAQQRMAVRS